LSGEEVQKNNSLMVKLSKEYSRLGPVVKLFEKFISLSNDKEAALILSEDEDEDLKILAKEELMDIDAQLIRIEEEITPLLLSSDPRDENNAFLEIRAGTGGDEAPFLWEIYLECMQGFANKKIGK